MKKSIILAIILVMVSFQYVLAGDLPQPLLMELPLGAPKLEISPLDHINRSLLPGYDVLLTRLMTHQKLHNPDILLDDFATGNTETAVIIHLKPTVEAQILEAHSKKSAHVPAEFDVTGAPSYYNLHDENVKTQLRASVGETVGRVIDQLGTLGVTVTHKFSYQFGYAARVTPEALERIVNSPDVLLVEKDLILQAHLAQGLPLMNAIIPRSTYAGSGLSIAICDTGIDTSHTALGGGGFPNAKVIGGYDFGDNDADPRPNGQNHGTCCAGIAAGYTGTVGDYIGGVAPSAKLYSIKISSGTTGSATTSAMIAGWEWAITHKNDDPANPIMIISTSFGGGGYSSACDSASPGMTTAAANAVAAGITIFASSGNDGYCNAIAWPACISYVNSVGAVFDKSLGTLGFCTTTASCAPKVAYAACGSGSSAFVSWNNTASDMVTSYSNSASFLTLLAPSHNATTTDLAGGYDLTFGGTSAACPYAAGAAAVLQQAAKAKTGAFLTPAQVRTYLVNYGDNVTDSKVAITTPRINLGKAVDALPVPTPSYTITTSAGVGGTITPTSTVNSGSDSTVTVTPGTGYHIATVLVDGVSQIIADPKSYGTTFTSVTANHTVLATFAIDTFTITTSAGANGTITPTATVNYGAGATVTVTPGTGYHIATVLVDAVSQIIADPKSYGTTFTSVVANHTVLATFAIDTFTITFNSNGGNTVSTQSVPYNSAATEPTAPTRSGSVFAGWYSDSGLTSGFSFTSLITANITLYAKWTATVIRVNAALAANGGAATASSLYSVNFPVSAVNNGDRKGVKWGAGGGWNDATSGGYPDWVQITFNGQKSINEIDVFTLQDNFAAPVEPTSALTFSKYGITAFDVQYWDGTAWVTVPGGSITGNNLVWQTVTFPAVTTDRIRVVVNASLSSYSRITEIEAYTDGGLINQPPTVVLTAPVTGTNYTALATIGLTASASDSDGTVSKVEFYNGATLLGTATTAPYGYTWSGVATGSYTLTAKATDNSGASTISPAVMVTVTAPANIPPTVTLTAPVTGAIYTAPATIGLTASASDPDGTVTKVEFYNGTTLLGAATTAPYGYTWSGVAAGSYTLTAKATDNSGASTTSPAVMVTVTAPANIPPTVTLTAPVTGAIYTAPATIGLTASASDSDGTVSKVEFYNGATLLGAATTAPYSYTWSGVVAGSYTLTARAFDNLGAVTTSTETTVTVTQAVTGANVALAANGGVATASSVYSVNFPVVSVNNGDRKGVTWGAGGGWNDGTNNTYPDWVQITFNGQKSINEIDVFTLQDNFTAPVEPTTALTFSKYGITAFDVQYWDGAAWVIIPGGSITGNKLVWRTVTFPAVTTDRIRVVVNASLAGYSRIMEIEAYTP